MENNIAYCIPTYNHPDTVKEVIGIVAEMYNKNGFDIYIYDTSETEDTRNIIEQYQNAGITNLYYIDMDPKINGNEKMVYILEGRGLRKEYEYIGIIKDRAYFGETTMAKVQAESHNRYDAIIMPVAYMPYDVYPQPPVQVYDNSVDFFRDYGALMPNLETVFFRRESMLDGVNWEDFVKKFFIGRECCFEQFIALFDGLARIASPHIRVLREEEVLRNSSGLSNSMWISQIFHVWAELWPKAVDILPKCYDRYKPLVKKQETMQPVLFGSPYNLMELARNNILTTERIEKLKDRWPELSDIPYECLQYIVENKQKQMISRLLVEWVKLFAGRKYPQAYHMFHTNPWLRDVLGGYKYTILKRCFEIYRMELEHGKENGIFRNMNSYNEAIENYQTMKYMLRRLEYDVADDIMDGIAPYVAEKSITVEYLSFIIMSECVNVDKVISYWEMLSDLYQKERQSEKK